MILPTQHRKAVSTLSCRIGAIKKHITNTLTVLVMYKSFDFNQLAGNHANRPGAKAGE
jgi:hypothetical protein